MKRRQLSELFFRISCGYWCDHSLVVNGRSVSAFTPWRIADSMRKWRWCQMCNRAERV